MSPDLTFHDLHRAGHPLILWNIWDAGSAQAVARTGAAAVATGSASVAGAWGYVDGQAIPLDLLLTVTERIAASVAIPLSVDFEAGYADTPDAVAANAARLEAMGAVGLNLEDGSFPDGGIRPAADQAAMIAAVRKATRLFINARTDLFLKSDRADHGGLMAQALDRAGAYADAGADGFFAPLLTDPGLIESLCRDCPLPVNIMAHPDAPPLDRLADLGVARISFGPGPWRRSMAALEQACAADTGAIRA